MSRRAPSPTSTTYSGISTYRSDPLRPLGSSRDQVPAVPPLDSRAIAHNHYDELRRFLASHLAKEPLNSRSSAREKLTRLTKQQFQELSTDVYDELIRRNTNSEQNEVPFLPVRDDFHPKRNQARQKLATLPKTRFKDLSSDVFYELGRRYPEFKEPETPPETPEGDEDAEKPLTASPTPTDLPARRPSEDSNPYSSRRKASGDVVGPLPDIRRKPSQDVGESSGYTPNQAIRRPSEDTVRSFTRKASDDSKSGGLYRNPSQSTANSHGGHSTATSGMVIPNKSTIAEERIEVPYGNDEVDSASDSGDRNRGSRGQRTISQGLGALGASLLAPMSPITDDEGTIDRGNRNRDTSDYYDKMSFGRVSVASSSGGAAFANAAGREAREEAEKMRSEYEYKIATMQKKLTTLEMDLSEANNKLASEDDHVAKLTGDLDALRKRTEEQYAVIRDLQQDLEEAQDARDRAVRNLEDQSRRQGGNDNEMRQLKAQLEEMGRELEASRRNSMRSNMDDMRGEVQTLVDELKSFIARNDELQTEREADQTKILSLTNEVQEYKIKYQHAKTELRNLKATSQLFLQQAPKAEDQLPVSPSGAILDIHVTAFQSATDSLLMAARSSAPSNVFAPMRSVVTAVTTIVDDLRMFEQRPPKDRMGVDDDTTKALRERAEATLSNLTVAAKNHAMGGGISPVSLVDAAASHVSASVVAIIKAVSMRKSTEAEQERLQYLAMSGAATQPTPISNKGPTLRSLDGVRGSERHGRTTSDASQWSNGGAGNHGTYNRRTFSDRSSNDSPQPPTIFDTASVIKNVNDTGNTTSEEGSDDAWEELKPYLDVQSEAIVLPIRNLLSAIRSGASAAELNENLTQIITIVSSVVAVCKDAIPVSSRAQGEETIQLLGDNCNKLSELQSQPEITKETRQAMASASFAVAKAMKELRSL